MAESKKESNEHRFISVQWDQGDKPLTEDRLKPHIELKTREKPIIKFDSENKKALLTFKMPQDIKVLKAKLKDAKLWTIRDMHGITETCAVKVTNLPTNATQTGIYRYFTNSTNLNGLQLNIKMKDEDFRPTEGYAILDLDSAEHVKKLCDISKQGQKYRDVRLEVNPHNREISTSPVPVSSEEFIVENIHPMKHKYLTEFCEDEIENQFKTELCADIKWPKGDIKSLKFVFDTQQENSIKRKQNWKKNVESKLETILKSLQVEERKLDKNVWREMCKISVPDDILMEKEDDKYRITVVGYKENSKLDRLLKDIDGIKPPPPSITKTFEFPDEKVMAFCELKLDHVVSKQFDVDVDVNKKTGKIKLSGTKDAVKAASNGVLEKINEIHAHTITFKNDASNEILNTPLMKDSIQNIIAEMDSTRVVVDTKCIVVFSLEEEDKSKIEAKIFSLIREESIDLPGKVLTNSEIENRLKQIETKFSPYVKVTHKVEVACLKIQVICGSDYFEHVQDELNTTVTPLLVVKEVISVSPYIFDYIQDQIIKQIEKQLKSKSIDKSCLQSVKEKKHLTVEGNAKVRETVMSIVRTSAENIKASWKSIEVEGIDMYMFEREGCEYVKSRQTECKCKIRVATKAEMKESHVHCITLLETGQAVFVATGDLTEPHVEVDVIVNSANETLTPRKSSGGLFTKIVRKGGSEIKHDCEAFVKTHGSLNPGDIYVGKSGMLSCAKIIHAVGPKGNTSNDTDVLRVAVENVLGAMNKDEEFILRSVAMPLLGTGPRGLQCEQSAEITAQTIKKCYKLFSNVREIYLYDTNPNTVRKIQQAMNDVFGDMCYHLPVQSIGLGKGTMTTFSSQLAKLSRSGSRTLPLPGGKKVIVEWGDLASKPNTNVLVNVTTTAPKPSGKIHHSLNQAAGAGFGLTAMVESEFKKVRGGVKNGCVVQTSSGRLTCDFIYHLKIADKWSNTNGCDNLALADYVNTCLQEAVKQNQKSIAFPTIGVADAQYPADKVALVMIRTIWDFMKLHAKCSLDTIAIVIYKKDISTTSAFEVTLEDMFSKRPHRLQAVIEESVENEELKQEDTKATPGQKTKYTVGDTVILEKEQGYLEDSHADVIVCVTSTFPKLYGAIYDALSKAGGPSLQTSCNNLYNKGYNGTGVPSSPAGNLHSKKVYYIKLDDYKKVSDSKAVSVAVTKCLEQADKDRMTSIAFPAVGTGGFKYPDDVSAKEMFVAIKNFFKSKRDNLRVVYVVLFPKADQVIKSFDKNVSTYFQVLSNTTGTKSTETSNAPGMIDPWKIPNTATEVDIVFGNLEGSKVDAIVGTTSSFPRLNGIIADSLLRVAGPELGKACKQHSDASEGDVIVTKGFNLQCKKVFHYVLKTWQKLSGRKIISDCMDDCLQTLKKEKLLSIAFPSIGTGGAKYDARTVANATFSEIEKFAKTNPKEKYHVTIVLYPTAVDVNKEFTDTFQAKKKGQKRVGFADDSDDKQAQKNFSTHKDFVLLQITSDDRESADLAFKSIKQKVDTETKCQDIDFNIKDGDDDYLEKMDLTKFKGDIEAIGEGNRLNVIVDLKNRKITVKGIGDTVLKCHNSILDYLQKLRLSHQQSKIGHIVFQYLEWCYTEDDGNILVPYPKHIAFQLEDANNEAVQEKVFKDNDGKTYAVDFNKMVEYLKTDTDKKDVSSDIKKKSTVCVIRKDLAAGDLVGLPVTWDAMGDLENVKEVVLKTTSKEYMDVETAFKATLGVYNLQNIKEIRRIQNRTLYQQYQTKCQQLTKECQGIANIERELWHGVKEPAEKLITSNGFNRSYAGTTFGGAVYYGMGVYFAVNSEYSTNPNYSAPDAQGWKRMYQVKVLTGNMIAVAQGYNDRYPPLLPGSPTDRYNSTCDDLNNPQEVVIYSDTQAYPQYIIIFK